MDYIQESVWCLYCRVYGVLHSEKGEFGVGSVLSIAVALIVSAFVLVPGMRDFAQAIIDGMTAWWTDSIHNNIFPTK